MIIQFRAVTKKYKNDNYALKNVNLDDKKILQVEAIIKSMTKKERLNPDIINYIPHFQSLLLLI